MEAKFHLSADQLVAVQQKKILYRLLTWITYIEQYLSIGNMPKELSDEVSEGLEYLKSLIGNFEKSEKGVSSTEFQEQLSYIKNFEGIEGKLERDANGNIHCDNCLVSYKYCKNMVGVTVRLRQITPNYKNESRTLYPLFAKHVEVVDSPEEKKTNESNPQDNCSDDSVGSMVTKQELAESLETIIEVIGSLALRLEKLASHTEQYNQISKDIDESPDKEVLHCIDEYEDYEGEVEEDEFGNFHCGKCLMPYNYSTKNNLKGKKVRISIVAPNRKNSHDTYHAFAKHVDIIE